MVSSVKRNEKVAGTSPASWVLIRDPSPSSLLTSPPWGGSVADAAPERTTRARHRSSAYPPQPRSVAETSAEFIGTRTPIATLAHRAHRLSPSCSMGRLISDQSLAVVHRKRLDP